MATKTFKIGEYCLGGIIKLQTVHNGVIVSVHDWDTKHEIGGKRFEFGSMAQIMTDPIYSDIQDWLEINYTTHYYAEKVAKYYRNLDNK